MAAFREFPNSPERAVVDLDHGFLVEQDVAIPANDGLLLRANVYRPDRPGHFPVVMAMGVYGKDVHFADAFAPQWKVLLERYPDLCGSGSSGRYLRWEMADPERWVPDDYIVINVDSRGSGKSPGFLDPFSPRETQDFHDAIEWAASQPWCNGKVGLLGVSYLAIKQWQVAALQPPHLAAIIPWEGASDLYRDWSHHGGIFSNSFVTAWWPRQVLANQHGSGESHYRDRDTDARTTGPAFDAAILKGNRSEHPADLSRHALDDAWYRERTPDLGRINTPLLSAANWGGPGVHLRGNIEAFGGAASEQKWLSIHVGTHFESFYLPNYVAMQKRFFAHFLKGEANGWDREPPVRLEVRWPDRAVVRSENEWPLASTQWTRYYLDAPQGELITEQPSTRGHIGYDALGDGVTFRTAPFRQTTEFTGPVTARLWVSSSTVDMDIFATMRAFAADGEEIIFTGAHEPTPVARGWLRASHRRCDDARSTPYRPFHPHDAIELLTPDEVYPVDVEIWPTCIVLPVGFCLALTVQGRDFEIGVPGRILHNDPVDRDPAVFGGVNTIHTGTSRLSYLLLPAIPERAP